MGCGLQEKFAKKSLERYFRTKTMQICEFSFLAAEYISIFKAKALTT